MIIEDLSSDGEGVTTLEGKKVFVDGALPGDEVEIEITEIKKRYSRARLLKLINPSPNRIDPICPLFGVCGGCQIMHLKYPEQLKWKRKRVGDALRRIGKIDTEISPCVPSPDQLGYRNKIHLHSGGFHKKHSHEIVPITKCYLQNPIGAKYLTQVAHSKEAIIKTAGEEVLIEIDGKVNRPNITEQLESLRFKIGPRDFFQVNPKQALQLYKQAIECANLDGQARVLDAYCGVGCLSLFAAQNAKEVVGIEIMKSAVESAKENAALNGINNTTFIAAGVEKQLPKLGSFDAIFLNPPRAGVDPAVIQTLLQHPPKKIIYISCDPATLARDLALLKELFKIEEVIPFDMFPQTVHVETLVSLMLY